MQTLSLSITPAQTATWRKQIFQQLTERTRRELENFRHYEQAVEQVGGPRRHFHQQALAERLLYTSAEVRGRSRRMRAALRLSARCEASLPGPRVHSEEEPILLFSPLKNRPGPTPSQARCRLWGPREHSSRGRGVGGPHAPGARCSAENRGRAEGGRRRSGRPQPWRATVRPGDKSREARGQCHSEDLAVSRLVAEKHRAGS